MTITVAKTYAARGGKDLALTAAEQREMLRSALAQFASERGAVKKALLIPPDFTRYHSGAGELTVAAFELLAAGHAQVDILPALGTHRAMTGEELGRMFPGVPAERFFVHDWRREVEVIGEIPGAFFSAVSGGRVEYSAQVMLNKRLRHGGYDLILSVGQIVPHEVIGLANQNKNIFIGVGGSDLINKSHFLGAAWGMERIMGRADTPVRQVLNFAEREFAADLPIVYALNVRSKDAAGGLQTRGLYIGLGDDGFQQAAKLSQQCNLDMLPAPLKKIVVYLAPEEFQSTWLGNKAVYRTRMVIADGGELVILAPGLKHFGEDAQIDKLIRRFGYVTTPEILRHVKENPELAANLSAAAHLIHGSSEGRFTITYCPGHLTRAEIESVNYRYAELGGMLKRYDPKQLKDGVNRLADGEEIYFISNPALGLWALQRQFA